MRINRSNSVKAHKNLNYDSENGDIFPGIFCRWLVKWMYSSPRHGTLLVDAAGCFINFTGYITFPTTRLSESI